ncbi:MAG: ABC transporter permease [Eubacteriales bacterium]|nr:ABC transporter permease [Eubacteriales bacterium]
MAHSSNQKPIKIESNSFGSQFSKVIDKLGIIVVLIFLLILMSLLTDKFLTPMNLTNVVRQISFIALIAIGVTSIIITTGIDLSSGSVVGLTSVVVASAAHPGQFPLVVTILIGLSVGLVVGLINGFLVAYAKLPPFIATMGTWTTVRGLALLYSNGRPVNDLKDEFTYLGGGRFLGVPVPILVLIAVAILTHLLLTSTRLGRHVFAIGGNEQAAIIGGINVKIVKLAVYVYASTLAALSGLLLTGRIASGQSALGVGYELDAIAAAVIGGTSLTGGIGSIVGTISGALVIGVINNGMDLLNVNMYWQQIAKGMIIVIAVFLDSQKKKAK